MDANLLADLRRGNLLLLQAEGDIAENIEVREKGVVLEDGIHIAAVRRKGSGVAAVDQDLPALRLLKSRHQAQDSGLPASAGTQQREEFSPPYLQRKILKRRMFPVALADAPKFDDALR